MNFLSEQSENSSIHNDELEKSHKLFKNYYQIKDSIKHQQISEDRSQRSIGSVQKAIQLQQLKNLQTRIVLTEKQYSKARQNNILLLKKLRDAQQNAQFHRFELQKIKRQKQQDAISYKNQIEKLRLQIQDRSNQKNYQQRQMSMNQILALRQHIDSKDKEISRLNLKIKSLELQFKSQQSMFKSVLTQKEKYQKQNQQLRLRTQTIRVTQMSAGAQLLELQQSRQAVFRLLSLLRSTEEYRRFSNYAEECKDIVYLQNIQKNAKRNSCDTSLDKRKSHSCRESKIDQRLLWAPSACYKVLLEIKLKYESMTQSCIQQILYSLNRIWLERQDYHVSKVRQEAINQINKIKRKNNQKYDEIIARKQIERLKKQLQGFRLTKKSPNDQIQLLKNLGSYEDQLRLKQKQIRLLSERIKLMNIQNNNYDKVLYLQGSLWVIDKILQQIEAVVEDFRQYQLRLQNNIENITGRENCQQFFKNYSQINNEMIASLNDKLVLIKQSILKKIGNNKNKFSQPNQANSFV